MFDFSWGEIMLIGVVALIVIGPKELPGVLRTIGQWVGKARRMAAEFQGQFHEAMREAEMADLKKHVDELSDTARGLNQQFDPLRDVGVSPASSAANPSPTPLSTSSSSPPEAAPQAQSVDNPVTPVDATIPVPDATPSLTEGDFASSPAGSTTSEHEERRA